MTISTAGVVVEGRNVEVEPAWCDAAGRHLARLNAAYGAPSLSAQITCIRKRSGHRASFEVHLVIRRGTRTVAVMQQGENVADLIDQAFASAQREMEIFVQVRTTGARSGNVHFGRIRWVDARSSFGFIDGGDVGDVHFTRDVLRGGDMTVGSAVSFALRADQSAPTADWVSVFSS